MKILHRRSRAEVCAFCHKKMRKVTIKGKTWHECPSHPRLLPKPRSS